jgi:hypothetical protein
MIRQNSLLRVFLNLDQITRPTINLFKKENTVKPLGRWCHLDYNKKCDTDRKIDLANIDNSFTSICRNESFQEPSKTRE